MGHAPTFEVLLGRGGVAWQGKPCELEAKPGVNVVAAERHVGIGVGQPPFLTVVSACGMVFHGNEYVALDATAGGELVCYLLRRDVGGGDKGDYGKEYSWGHGNGGVVCMA